MTINYPQVSQIWISFIECDIGFHLWKTNKCYRRWIDRDIKIGTINREPWTETFGGTNDRTVFKRARNAISITTISTASFHSIICNISRCLVFITKTGKHWEIWKLRNRRINKLLHKLFNEIHEGFVVLVPYQHYIVIIFLDLIVQNIFSKARRLILPQNLSSAASIQSGSWSHSLDSGIHSSRSLLQRNSSLLHSPIIKIYNIFFL